MRFLSVCSGIEAASVAWSPLGWKAAALSEIEPCAVLAHHYPDVPNLGDMTRFQEWPDLGSVDLLCGGTPCQSFSVAGLRKGLDDPRGNLMLTFGAIAAKHRPRWLVWENVPGVLSSNDGRDFGSFLGLLGQLGYGFAYRVLDAQHFGVPQRRRRVFVVGCLGDWRRAVAVLFERHSLSGHPAPSRQTREGTASGAARSLAIRGRDGTPQAELGDEVANAILTPSGGRAGIGVGAVVTGLASTARPLLAGGHSTNPLDENLLVAFDPTQITSAANRNNPQPGDPCHTLAKGAHAPAIAVNWQAGGKQTTLGGGPLSSTLVKDQIPGVMVAAKVRRLTPRECERLQGFPDDYTAVRHRNKPAADGPRYKALGNSWAVPCARWIGRRIQAVEAITLIQEAA